MLRNRASRDTTTPHRKRSRFLTFLECYVFHIIIDYNYDLIKCDKTGKVDRVVREIGPWQCSTYFGSSRVNSKISLQNVRTFIVNRYSDWFGFLRVGAACLNQWQEIAIKHHVNTNASSKDPASLSFFCLGKNYELREYGTSKKVLVNFHPKQSCIRSIRSISSIKYASDP